MQPRRPRDHKLTPDSELSGQKAVNLIEQVVLGMDCLWHPRGAFDPGIDGRIELRDARTKQPLARYLGVQSKGYARYTAETDDGFGFLCDLTDVNYWMGSNEPVLLVCSHPETREAWFVCITDYFADAERRASRRVRFDKHTDRFDASRADDLLRLGTRSEPVLHRQPPAPPEDLITNLLPVREHPAFLWAAPTDLYAYKQAHGRYLDAGGPRASDYLLREGHLYALRDPRSCPLKALCESEDVESFPVEEWADSNDVTLQRYWVELLRRTLFQQLKPHLSWHPTRGLFYFDAPEPLADLSIDGPTGRRQVVKVEYYLDKRDGKQHLKYARHHAFRPNFQRVDGRWHLEVEPDYFFSSDGQRDHGRGDEYLAGIKKLEKNLSVLGHLRMWAHLLNPPPSLLEAEPKTLTFGDLVTVRVPVGIDDALWQGKAADKAPSAKQDELAA